MDQNPSYIKTVNKTPDDCGTNTCTGNVIIVLNEHNIHIHCNVPQLLIHHTNRLNRMATCMLQVMCPVYVQLP